MAKKSKLELIMELGDKMFNNKLSQVQSKLSAATDKMEGKLQGFNMKQIKIFSNFGKTLDPTAMNSISEMAENLNGKLDFTKDISNTKTMLAQFGVKDVDGMANSVHKLGKIWEASDEDIAKSANALTKQLGGTFESNLGIIQAGFEKGANLNGDMLDQFKEYAPQIKELGLSATDMLAIMANAGKEGIFSDKAIDSIKEANLSLKEMGQPQVDALKGIGLEVKDLAGKTSFEAVQMIAKSMEGATAQAKQLALTDIFKGAGEDAGMSFILGLGSMDLNPENLPSFKQADEGLKSWISNVESTISDKLGGMMPYLQGIGMAAITISSLISIIQSLTAAQWLSNLAAAASPYMLVALAIGAIIAVIVVAINYFDQWGAALLVFLGPIGRIIAVFKLLYDHWDSIKKAFESDGIIGALKRIGIVLLDVVLKPIQQILEMVGLDSWAGKVQELRKSMDLVTPGEKENNSKTGEAKGVDLRNDPMMGKFLPGPQEKPKELYKAPLIDGKLAPDDKKKKKQGDNINKVAGQANQVRNITITVDAFNKGGINVAKGAYEGMTKADVEAWFKEMLRRVIINGENI